MWFSAVNLCVITMQINMFTFSSHPSTVLWVSVVLFLSSVSPTDGDKKKRQKGKGTLEPTLGLPTKLATLKVLSSQTLQHRHSVLLSHYMFRLKDDRKYSYQQWWTKDIRDKVPWWSKRHSTVHTVVWLWDNAHYHWFIEFVTSVKSHHNLSYAKQIYYCFFYQHIEFHMDFFFLYLWCIC